MLMARLKVYQNTPQLCMTNYRVSVLQRSSIFSEVVCTFIEDIKEMLLALVRVLPYPACSQADFLRTFGNHTCI